ncbi:MAG: ABC transporter permease [Anaerolineales bacterium]|nr:ABC transporter permease [Anaerolineales bacterium]
MKEESTISANGLPLKKQNENQPLSRLTDLRHTVADYPEIITLFTFVVIFLYFALAAPDTFLSALALSNILTFGGITGVVVIGVAFLMISGEFDLSVGSNLAVASYVFALSLVGGIPAVPAMLLALLVSVLLGLVNGLIVAYSRIPSFIVTLGTLFAYRGLARILGEGVAVKYTPDELPGLFAYLNGSLAALNNLFDPTGNFRASSLWFIALIIIMTVILERTRYGNWTFATGGNALAARSQGVNVKAVKIINFMISGCLAGLAGILIFSQRNSATPLAGTGMELIAVAAAVIGGVRLTGGYGTIIGASIGVLLMSMLEQGLALLGIPNEIFRAVAGFIIIVTVAVNTYLRKAE